ncbi:MAG TPA: helix-turn-helix domain-containing protein [Gemmatimonadaceae bacterium]|nr:helix-turn-helix domain-containing protein [Gemmatimonadaceae bacterium]
MVKKSAARKAAPIQPDGDAEQRILDAAHKVFVRRGTAGARMQEIADEAGVNKALLHYYFRNKSRLADAIFQRVAGGVFSRIMDVALSDAELEEKVPHIIGAYLEQLARTPYAPGYVLGELSHHPERGKQLIDALGRMREGASPRAVLEKLQRQLDQRIAEGTIKPISAQQFLTNLVSLCIFPFAAKPLLCAVMELDDAGFAAFIDERRRVLPEFFLNALRP